MRSGARIVSGRMEIGTDGNGGNGAPRRYAHESRLYGRFSHLYDAVLSRVFIPRVTEVIRSLAIPRGARVLEVGVGTGGALPAYPDHCEVVGVDLSTDMLREAQRKICQNAWTHVRTVEGDATRLPFDDDSFDYVCAFHMVTVVDDPVRLMQGVVRVCRPGGLVTIVNRFRSDSPALDRLERRLEPLTRKWGWTSLSRGEVLDPYPLEVLTTRHGGPLGLFTAVVARNVKGVA